MSDKQSHLSQSTVYRASDYYDPVHPLKQEDIRRSEARRRRQRRRLKQDDISASEGIWVILVAVIIAIVTITVGWMAFTLLIA